MAMTFITLEFTKLAFYFSEGMTREKKIIPLKIQSTDTKLNLHLLFSYTLRKLDAAKCT